MRLALFLLLLFALAAPAQAETRWLCSAAMTRDPCDRPGDTVRLTAGGAVRVPSRETRRRVDCFYVYPTVSEQKRTNATRVAAPEIRSIATYQAARFSSQCRVFAPLYRQVTLQGIFSGGLASNAREIAYDGVRAAWRTYLRRYNRGRGVVLIGHSQGTGMLRKLIADEIDPKPAVRRRLVSALLLGGNVLVKRGRDRGGDFAHVPLCTRAAQAGCVIAYSTFLDDPPADAIFGRAAGTDALTGEPVGDDVEVACVNPASIGANAVRTLTTINPSVPFAGPTIRAGIELLWGGPLPRAGTTWNEPTDRYAGRCETINGARVLKLAPVAGARHLTASPNAGWGLHLVDVNGALGDLETDVGREIRTYLRR